MVVDGVAAVVVEPVKGDQPNFVVVFFDDLGFSDLGAFGSEIPTPRMSKPKDSQP